MSTYKYNPEVFGLPYTVLVGHDSDVQTGEVRIEPPATISDDLLELLYIESDVKVTNSISGKESTLLVFRVDTESDWAQSLSNQERLDRTLVVLADQLGKVALGSTFKEEWSKF